MATSASGQRCRCTLALSGSDIAVKCKGEARIERTVGRTFSAPVEILPGLRLFGDPFETGQRSFLVVENREIELRDIHFTDNLFPEGSAIVSPISIVNSTVWIQDCTFKSTYPPSIAGGLYMSRSIVHVRDSLFSGVSTEHRSEAGAIRLTNNSSLTVSNSKFLRQVSSVSAIYADQDSNITLSNTVFLFNKGKQGSAVLAKGGTVYINNSDFTNGLSDEKGAVSVQDGGGLVIESSTFRQNRGNYGAAVCFIAPYQAIDVNSNHRPAVEIKSSTFASNVAFENGGALYIRGANLFISDSFIGNNQASDLGAGLYIFNADQVMVTSSSFEKQHFKSVVPRYYEKHGGGIFATEVSRFHLINSRISDNSEAYSGAGAYFESVSQLLDIQDSVISNNDASDQAGISARGVKSLKMTNVSFLHNTGIDFAAGLYLAENSELIMRKTQFIDNSAWSQAAVSIRSSSSIKIEDSLFENNTAIYRFAAALHIDAAFNVSIAKSKFIQNRAREQGAAIHAWSVDKIFIEDSEFDHNTGHTGGACAIQQCGTLRVTASNFTCNEAQMDSGGSLYLDIVDRMFIKHSLFFNNAAKSGGGAIAGNAISHASFVDTIFEDNNSTIASGGGINFREVDNVYLKQCHLHNNGASVNGGAVSLESVYNEIDIKDSIFSANAATGRQESSGGALAIGVFSRMKIKGSKFEDNKASYNGGAVNLPTTTRELRRTVDIRKSTFRSNGAQHGSGGAIYFEKSSRFSVDDCRFESNSASLEGGAIVVKTGDWVSVSDSHFTSNSLKIETEEPSHFFSSTRQAGRFNSRLHDSFPDPSWSVLNNQDSHDTRSKDGGAMTLVSIKKVILTHTHMTANMAPGSGGGAFIQGVRRMVARRFDFEDNVALTSGGGLFLQRLKSVELVSSSFKRNRVSREEPSHTSNGILERNGGAIVLKESKNVHLTEIEFTDNRAAHSGGAASFHRVSNMTVRACGFKSNSAFRGGAVQIRESLWGEIGDCVFEGNAGLGRHAYRNAMAGQDPAVVASDADHGGHGGAIMIERSSELNLTSPAFRSNQADGDGGALHCSDAVGLKLTDSSFLNNTANSNGGAISLRNGNLSLGVDQFRNNKATNGGILSVRNSFLDGYKLQTAQNLAEIRGGLVYCQEPSNVTITASKFVDDGSLQGSAFEAGCGCHLAVAASKIVCSNADVRGCGSVASDSHCNGDVTLETAHVIHYHKLWSIIVLIVPALFVLPCAVLVAKACARLSITLGHKAGLQKDVSDLRGNNFPRSPLSDIRIEDSPFWRPPDPMEEISPAGDVLERSESLRSHQLSEPLLERPDRFGIGIPPLIKHRPAMMHSISSKPSSAYIGPQLTHPGIDPLHTVASIGAHPIPDLPSSSNNRSGRITDYTALEQQDFRAEYEEMRDMGSDLFSLHSLGSN